MSAANSKRKIYTRQSGPRKVQLLPIAGPPDVPPGAPNGCRAEENSALQGPESGNSRRTCSMLTIPSGRQHARVAKCMPTT